MSTATSFRNVTDLRSFGFHTLALLSLVLIAGSLTVQAQDTVTISKSRLEELERNEAELQKLKQAVTNPPAGKAPAPYAQPGAITTLPGSPGAALAVTRASPPVTSLPPLQEGEVVESLDLANQYRADPAAADQRYRGRKFTVRGQIAGFEKPMLKKNYKMLLPGPDRATMVICDLLPPEKFNAVFTIDHGVQLVGQFGENRETLARVGQAVLVNGRCRGWKDSSVIFTADSFQPVR
ncbi:MAG TPA: hypothetical protein VNZ64_20730 [Candidatus Acidoferrum sp.]|jgi:hypothetical protein|nr:hypothetical protein [Candidatus Acidoferrum sp.]